MRTLTFALVLLSSPITWAAAEVGKPAPSFALPDENGKTHSLADYKGQVVVLEWTNPECPFVKRHYKARTMQTVRNQFKGQKVVWLAVDSSNFVTAADVKKWHADNGIDYPTLLDSKGDVGKGYGAKTTPHMFVIDGQGVVRYAGAIDDDAWDGGTNIKNFVKEAVTAVLAGKAPDPAQTQPYGCTVKYK